jgi:3-oxoadipate enol-lactonase
MLPHHVLSGPRDAPVLAMSVSLGTDLSMWDPQLPALAERYRVLRYDLRGHGASPIPAGPYSIGDLGGDVLEVLDHLKLDRVCLCGLSIGAMASIWVAAHAPDRVERLVACCTSAHFGDDASAAYRARAQTVVDQGLEPIADAALARWFTPRFIDAHPQTVERVRRGLLSTSREGYAGCCEALATLDLRPALRSVEAPTLVIAGRQDPATPPEHGRVIADGVRAARFEVIEDAAHLANIEQPDAMTKLITEHLEEAI